VAALFFRKLEATCAVELSPVRRDSVLVTLEEDHEL